MEYTLGSFTVKPPTAEDQRLSMLLWGPAGCGKTTLAATAPGKKLYINFDPDGPASIVFDPVTQQPRTDILVLDLSDQKYSIVEKFKTDDGLGIGKLLADPDTGIETVVVDSLTSFTQLATDHGIAHTKGATLERPSPGAYGARNALTLRLVTAILRLTAQYKKNVIFITHEDGPTTNDEGAILFITMQLGGKLPDQTALRLSEVWHMSDTGKERRIALRPVRTRKPMKSRLFDASSKPEFVWKYDIEKPDHTQTLEYWFNTWKAGNGKKLQVP